MRSCILVTLLSLACGSRLRNPSQDAKLQPDEEQACALVDAPKGSFDNALTLVLPNEKDAAEFVAAAEKAEDASATPTAEEKKEWKAAMAEYVKAQSKMKNSQDKLLKAMSNMLEVPAVNTAKVNTMVDAKKKDMLVVFYAPWCPHCQTFVLHDGKGSPEKAPLEVLNRGIKASGADKTLNIVRFDVAADREAGLPKGFEVKHIPTIYMAAADGTKTVFDGQGDIIAFIEKNSAKTKKIAVAAAKPDTIV